MAARLIKAKARSAGPAKVTATVTATQTPSRSNQRRSIIPLLAAASKSLPEVASHALGFAEPRPGVHSPGFGAHEQDGQ